MTTFTITTPVNVSALARLGSVAALAWTRSTTTATVTQNAHGMASNDVINVSVTSDATAITLGAKTITVVNANSYTFTCLNAGAASGTVTANHLDDMLINGGYLTYDTHTRYGLGANLYAAVNDIVMSASLGGTVEFNSTLVRLIAYNTGTGNVPALDTTISQGSASGKLLGVYSALNVAPTAAGAAMPASGYILIRQWNSVAYTAAALTGIGATATAADRAGWLEIVAADLSTITVNRLNLFKVRGDYFDLGTTDGTRATTYQIPSNGSAAFYLPGVEVETGTGTGVYEFYPCAGTRTALLANIGTEEIRGRWCWISTAGLLRFGHDGTNSTGGFIPPAGRKIRVANVFFQNCTQAAPTVNVLPNATLATRCEFATTGGGVVDIDKASMGWYCNFAQAFSVALTNVRIFSALVLTECASPIAWANVGIGQEAANSQTALTMGLNFAGGTLDKCTWTRSALGGSGNYIALWTDCIGFTVTNERLQSLTKNNNATTGSILKTRVTSSTWTNTVVAGGRFSLVGCADLNYASTIYYDTPGGATGTAIPMYVWDLNGAPSYRIKMDGLTFGGLTMCPPYSGILLMGVAGCQNLTLRNIGTPAAPLDCGSPYVDATWTRATTTMTVTKVAHGLRAADLIAVMIASDVGPKAVTTTTATLWTVASVPTADTFTVTVTNGGATSGTLSYYLTLTGSLVVGLAGGAPLGVRVQRCYMSHMRGQAIATSDNSSKNITFENVWINDWATQLVPLLNTKFKGLLTNIALTAQTSVYGTHFLDYYTTGVPPSLSGVTWNRTTTVATVTLAGHNLKTGDLVTVSVSSDTAAIILGTKTITATTSGAFTFSCLNAGAASGTLTIQPHNSRIAIAMNEPTADTVSQVALTNGAAFTSAGGLYMPVIGHQADFTAPDNIRGHSSFPVAEAIMAGGTIANYDITYSLDGGTTYKNLYYPRPGGGGANASTNVTMTSTTGVAAGDYVWGTNIAPLAKVVSITNGTTVVVDRANIGTVSGVLRFNQLPSETVADALVGFPLRVRIKTSTTNATAITSLLVTSESTTTARTATYPLDTITLSVTGLVTGSDVVVRAAGTDTILASVDAYAGTSWNYVYETPQAVDIDVIKPGYVPLPLVRNYNTPSVNSALPASQLADRNYLA